MIALSTAFSNALVGLDINGKTDFACLDASCKQSENILKTIDDLLNKNILTINDNQEYAVVVGPGSFTGLRVGTALVKGLCAGSSKPCKVVAISSLDLMAYIFAESKPKKDFICAINALSGLCFVCEYDASGKKIGEERLIERIQLENNNLIVVGLRGEGIAEIEVEFTAEKLLEFAKTKSKNGDYVDYKAFSPVYLRKSQAEVGLEQKNLKKS